MAQGCDVSQILECLTVSGLTGASELLINQNFSVPQKFRRIACRLSGLSSLMSFAVKYCSRRSVYKSQFS